jgi:hypothetical protein
MVSQYNRLIRLHFLPSADLLYGPREAVRYEIDIGATKYKIRTKPNNQLLAEIATYFVTSGRR